MTGVIDGFVASNDFGGIGIDASLSNAVAFSISNSVASNNLSFGVAADSTSANLVVSIDHSSMNLNGGFGVLAEDARSFISNTRPWTKTPISACRTPPPDPGSLQLWRQRDERQLPGAGQWVGACRRAPEIVMRRDPWRVRVWTPR